MVILRAKLRARSYGAAKKIEPLPSSLLQGRASAYKSFPCLPCCLKLDFSNVNRPSFASLVNSAVSAAQSLKALVKFDDGEEESDDWLTADEGTVDRMLTQSLPVRASSTVGAGDMDVNEENPRTEFEDKVTKQAGQLRNLADKVEKFVEGQGDAEGVKFDE